MLLSAVAQTSIKPNFVFVLADDIGFGDVSFNNVSSRIHQPGAGGQTFVPNPPHTPHLDEMAHGPHTVVAEVDFARCSITPAPARGEVISAVLAQVAYSAHPASLDMLTGGQSWAMVEAAIAAAAPVLTSHACAGWDTPIAPGDRARVLDQIVRRFDVDMRPFAALSAYGTRNEWFSRPKLSPPAHARDASVVVAAADGATHLSVVSDLWEALAVKGGGRGKGRGSGRSGGRGVT